MANNSSGFWSKRVNISSWLSFPLWKPGLLSTWAEDKEGGWMEKVHASGKDSAFPEFEKYVFWGWCCCFLIPNGSNVDYCLLANQTSSSFLFTSTKTCFEPTCLSWTQQHPLKRCPWQRGGSCCLSPRCVSWRCANGSHFMVTFPACNTASLSRISIFWGIRQLLYYMIKFINRSLMCFWDWKAFTAYYQVTAKLIFKTVFKLLVVMKGSSMA